MKKAKKQESFKNEKIKMGWMLIPNQIVFNNELNSLTKFVLGLILSFQFESQCYAKDEWFADQFGVSIRTIENIMKDLRDKGYIETFYDHRTKERIIVPADKTIWDAYSAIRRGAAGLAETQGPRKAKKADPEETDPLKDHRQETEKKDPEETDPLKEKKDNRNILANKLKKLWEN